MKQVARKRAGRLGTTAKPRCMQDGCSKATTLEKDFRAKRKSQRLCMGPLPQGKLGGGVRGWSRRHASRNRNLGDGKEGAEPSAACTAALGKGACAFRIRDRAQVALPTSLSAHGIDARSLVKLYCCMGAWAPFVWHSRDYMVVRILGRRGRNQCNCSR